VKINQKDAMFMKNIILIKISLRDYSYLYLCSQVLAATQLLHGTKNLKALNLVSYIVPAMFVSFLVLKSPSAAKT